MAKCAIMLRGHHHRIDRYGNQVDSRSAVSSYQQQIIQPLKKQFEQVDIFLCTHPSHVETEIVKTYEPVGCYIDHDGWCYTQKHMMFKALAMLRGSDYDKYFILRFDCLWKKPVTEWDVWLPGDNAYIPWREYHHLWMEGYRVGDQLHVVDGNCLQGFADSLVFHHREADMNFHYIYDPLVHMLGRDKVKFMCEGYFDSDPIKPTPLANNPLFYILGRMPKVKLL